MKHAIKTVTYIDPFTSLLNEEQLREHHVVFFENGQDGSND